MIPALGIPRWSSHDLRLIFSHIRSWSKASSFTQKIPFPGIRHPPIEFLPFQVLNKDSKTHVWSLHAPFSSALHTLHHLGKYKHHGSVLRLRTDSLHKHFYNKSWLIHCQNSVSVEGGWDGRRAESGKWKPSMSEQGNKWGAFSLWVKDTPRVSLANNDGVHLPLNNPSITGDKETPLGEELW